MLAIKIIRKIDPHKYGRIHRDWTQCIGYKDIKLKYHHTKCESKLIQINCFFNEWEGRAIEKIGRKQWEASHRLQPTQNSWHGNLRKSIFGFIRWLACCLESTEKDNYNRTEASWAYKIGKEPFGWNYPPFYRRFKREFQRQHTYLSQLRVYPRWRNL